MARHLSVRRFHGKAIYRPRVSEKNRSSHRPIPAFLRVGTIPSTASSFAPPGEFVWTPREFVWTPREFVCARPRVRLCQAASSFVPGREFVRATWRVRSRRRSSSFARTRRVRSYRRSSSFVPGREFVRATRRVRSCQAASSFAPRVEFVRATRRVRSYRRSSSFVPGREFVRTAGRVRSCHREFVCTGPSHPRDRPNGHTRSIPHPDCQVRKWSGPSAAGLPLSYLIS